jgi:hypothetical protein
MAEQRFATDRPQIRIQEPWTLDNALTLCILTARFVCIILKQLVIELGVTA